MRRRETRTKLENPVFNVYGLRMALKLSQKTFAKLVPTTERTVSRWERNGLTPKGFMLRRLKKLHEELAPETSVSPVSTPPRPQMGDALRQVSGF